jgi:hypothetical protein
MPLTLRVGLAKQATMVFDDFLPASQQGEGRKIPGIRGTMLGAGCSQV